MPHVQDSAPFSLVVLGFVIGLLLAGPASLRAQESEPSGQPFDLYEQAPRYITKSWTVEDGLPLNMVWALEQTRDGTLWVGTLEGLAVFDGAAFTTYSAAETKGLRGNRVSALLEDGDGTLWIGTQTGLSVRQEEGFRTIEGPSYVAAFGKAPSGRVWMVGPSGLYHSTSEGSTSKGVRRVSLPDSLDKIGKRSDVAPAGTDSVWIAAGGHLLLYHNGHFRKTGVSPTGRVHAIDVGPAGRLWVGTTSEVMAVGRDTTRRYIHGGDIPHSIKVDSTGTAWVATREAGLLRVSEGSVRRAHPTSQLEGEVRDVLRDDTGQWWAGTQKNGLVRLRPRLFWPVSENAGFRGGAHGVYTDDHGAVWVGSFFQGCRFTSTTRNCYPPDDAPQEAQVYRRFYEDGASTLWAVTNEGLVQRRDRRFEPVPTPEGNAFHESTVMHRDAAGTLWIASQQGLFRYRDDSLKRVLLSERVPSSVNSIHRDSNGAVWMGTRGHGVARYDEGRLRWFDGDNGVPYKNVRDIYETDEGTIWIGTYGGGIARFEGERFTAVTPEDGLPAGTIHAIREEPDGIFWMTSNDGVFRLRRSLVEAVADGRQERLYAQTFGTADGMLVRECNGGTHPAVTRDRQGRFWVATVKGPAVVDPHAPALAVPNSIPVRVTDLRADGQPQPLDSLGLAPSTYRVALDFTAISLRHADDLSFRYRLDGKDWTPARGRRTAEFTSLDAGTHRFEVQATINGETWYTLETPLRFTVAPHFYETWWFRLLVVLGVIGVALGVYRWRTVRLRRRQEELEQAVKDRTRELAEEKEKTERQAERLAELDEAKNRFFAHISHEFRTPLSLILGPVRDALQRVSDGAATLSENQLRRMVSNAERLERLIEQLLDLATLEAGRMELECQPGDLASTVQRVAEAFRSKAREKDIDLRVARPEGGIETRFDPEKVETIISNLVGNAVKFTPNGGKVTVRVEEEAPDASVEGPASDESPRGTARIKVADTGPGIDPDVQEAIFDRFEQADNSTTREHEGTGLGLALTSELIELHGGTIAVDSAPGEGATFAVELPVVPVTERAARERECTKEYGGVERREPVSVSERGPGGDGRAAPQRDKNGDSREAATILVVEDNTEMRAYLREELCRTYTVLEATDGEEGWQMIQSEQPDLVVSDVMMPGVDGFELCRRIKTDDALRAIPVLLLTARTEGEATREGLQCGADDYVTKPFDAEELKQRIENHLAARRHLEARYREEVEIKSVGTAIEAEERPFVEEVLAAVEEQLGDPDFGVGDLAEAMALSRRQLTRRLKKTMERTPGELIKQRRLKRAKGILRGDPGTIAEVGYAVGFRSASHFSNTFREAVGQTPTEYAEQHGE